jgi:hypothetical protein
LLNSIDPKQLQQLKIPDCFKGLVRPRAPDIKTPYKKLDKEDLKAI